MSSSKKWVTKEWGNWDELTGVNQHSSLALACMYATIHLDYNLEWSGQGDAKNFYGVTLEELYRFWYLTVKAANKEIAGSNSAIKVSRGVEEFLFEKIGYFLLPGISPRQIPSAKLNEKFTIYAIDPMSYIVSQPAHKRGNYRVTKKAIISVRIPKSTGGTYAYIGPTDYNPLKKIGRVVAPRVFQRAEGVTFNYSNTSLYDINRFW